MTAARSLTVAMLAFGLAGTALAQRTKNEPPPPLTFRDSVIAVEQRFLAQWDTTWMLSERDRHGFSSYGDNSLDNGPRHQNYHCHPDDRSLTGPIPEGRFLRSSSGWYAVCPSWDLGEVRTTVEERGNIDDVITSERRPLIRSSRLALIVLLDSATRRAPTDDFYAGQRVRMLVDQREFDEALAAATQCRATQWWCSLLAGYVHGVRGDDIRATAQFDAAVSAMPQKEKCRWTDFRAVIDIESRDRYASVACDKRDALNTRLWWLTDPLFLEPENERRTEQIVRMVLITLHSALERDERFSWLPEVGGDARVAMVLRYGWPSYSYWGGMLQDQSHSGYLRANRSPVNEHYTTAEYAGPRAHLVPSWTAISDPFAASPEAWTLTAMAAQQKTFWWPAEHAQLRKPVIQLPSGMRTLLRRNAGAMLAVSTDLVPQHVVRVKGDTIPGIALLASHGPGNVERVALGRGEAGQPFEIHGIIPATPAVISLEYPGGDGATSRAGRLRFGVKPPPALAALKAGETGVSEPVLLRVPADGSALPIEMDDALRYMATSRTVAGAMVGVYWETYGYKPGDTVEVAVWIERATAQSIARKFGIALRVATDLNTPVAVSWTEPNPSRRSYVIPDGAVPIIGRTVILDVGQLAKGEYRLEVAARKPGAEAQRGKTTFVIP